MPMPTKMDPAVASEVFKSDILCERTAGMWGVSAALSQEATAGVDGCNVELQLL